MRTYSNTGAATTVAFPDYRSITSSDYGAVGNDSTDNTAVIQAAIDEAAQDGGGVVYVPKGTFRHTGLNLNGKQKVSLIGVDRALSVLRHTNPTGHGITADGVGDLFIKHLKLHPLGKTSGYEIYLGSTGRITIDNIFLKDVHGGFSAGEITQGNSSWNTITNVFADNWKTLLYVVNTIDSNFSNWTTYNNLHLDSIGILMDGGCEGNQFSFIGPVNATPDANTSHSAPNLRIQQGAYTAKVSGYNSFTNMYFDTHNTGVELLNCFGTSFVGCWFSARPGRGVYIGPGSHGIQLIGNKIMGSGTDGVMIDGGSDHIIKDNLISNSNTGGIYLNDAASNVQITGNTVTRNNWFRLAGQDGFGIGIHPNANNYLIKDNVVSGMTDKIIKWDKAAGAKTAITTEDTATRIIKDNLFSV